MAWQELSPGHLQTLLSPGDLGRPAGARRERQQAERAAADPLADFAGSLVYDGYLDAFRPADLFSGDPLDMEAIAVWKEENGVPWDPDSGDHAQEPLTADPRPASGLAVGYAVRCATTMPRARMGCSESAWVAPAGCRSHSSVQPMPGPS
jgi:hypothetical protein